MNDAMPVIRLIQIGSVLLLPIAGLLALRWAMRAGQMARLEGAASLPFDLEEPEGRMTDQILGDNRR